MGALRIPAWGESRGIPGYSPPSVRTGLPGLIGMAGKGAQLFRLPNLPDDRYTGPATNSMRDSLLSVSETFLVGGVAGWYTRHAVRHGDVRAEYPVVKQLQWRAHN